MKRNLWVFKDQTRTKKYLQRLKLTSILEWSSSTVTEAPEELQDRISGLSPQGPTTHRREEEKVEYLYEAVFGVDWAQSALTKYDAVNTSLKLSTVLHSIGLRPFRKSKARKKKKKKQ